jgi:15-cis-phytoene synthase
MDPHAYCQQRAARSGSSFYYSFLFLPPEKRRAIMALYAFCREVDDVVDETPEAAVAQAQLDFWRHELVAMAQGSPTHPVTRALADVRQNRDWPVEQLLEIIDGMQMDLERPRYPDFKTLSLYTYRVASVVGLLSAELFGWSDRATLRYAHDLGTAFQLTNIIRDVGEDARRGRIYLPMDELERFHVPAREILEGQHSERFVALMQFQYARAQGLYDKAFAALPSCDRKNQRPGLVMAAIYRCLLEEIAKDGFHVLDRRTRLTPLRKLWIAWRTWKKA